MEQAREYFTDDEIASDPEFRGLFARSTLQKKRVAGGGPQFAKVGGRCLYRREWIRAWLASDIRFSTSDAA